MSRVEAFVAGIKIESSKAHFWGPIKGLQGIKVTSKLLTIIIYNQERCGGCNLTFGANSQAIKRTFCPIKKNCSWSQTLLQATYK